MTVKAPMVGVVVSPSLLQRIKAAQERERRKSLSEFCSLLLEYAETVLELEGVPLLELLDRIRTGHAQRDGASEARDEMHAAIDLIFERAPRAIVEDVSRRLTRRAGEYSGEDGDSASGQKKRRAG